MSESVADDILRNGFDRWKRLEEEKQAISDDLKELFAELKGQGFDSKALRAAFRHVVKIDDLANQEHEAVVDLYVESLTRDTRMRAREIIEEFPAETVNPETGEITEPQSVPSAAQGSDEAPFVASQPHPEAKASTDSGATAQATERPADSVTGDVSRASVGAGSDAPIQPETEAPYVPQPVPSMILPEVPADFITDQTPDQLAARMRRTLKARPACQHAWSCGRMADQSECAQCLKAAQERAA